MLVDKSRIRHADGVEDIPADEIVKAYARHDRYDLGKQSVVRIGVVEILVRLEEQLAREEHLAYLLAVLFGAHVIAYLDGILDIRIAVAGSQHLVVVDIDRIIRYAGALVHQHTQGDILAVLVIGEVFIELIVEVELALFIQHHDRRCGELLCDRRDRVYDVRGIRCTLYSLALTFIIHDLAVAYSIYSAAHVVAVYYLGERLLHLSRGVVIYHRRG